MRVDPFIEEQVRERVDLANKTEQIQNRIKRRKLVTEYDKKLQSADKRLLKRLQKELNSPLKTK